MVATSGTSVRRTKATAIVLAALVQIAGLVALLNGLAVVPLPGRRLETLVSIDFSELWPVVHIDDSSLDPERHRRGRAPAVADEGATAPAAIPHAVVAPPPRTVPIAPPVPPIAATGLADRVGASITGPGGGAGDAGSGSGGGDRGSGGQGGGGASGPVKLSGEIGSARDFPTATRDLRLGDYVILALSIDTTGMVDGCRIVRAGRDAAADAITCRLIRERFRFRPARDAAGRAIRSTYGWKQRWFRPGTG